MLSIFHPLHDTPVHLHVALNLAHDQQQVRHTDLDEKEQENSHKRPQHHLAQRLHVGMVELI